MGLDYSNGSVNFRDVGEWLHLLAGRAILPTGCILRGGKMDFVRSAAQIGCPGTITNLRKGSDPPEVCFGAQYYHFPISNAHEKYNTQGPAVRR